MSEFLKKLQTALDKGEQDEDVKQFMENIEKKADPRHDSIIYKHDVTNCLFDCISIWNSPFFI